MHVCVPSCMYASLPAHECPFLHVCVPSCPCACTYEAAWRFLCDGQLSHEAWQEKQIASWVNQGGNSSSLA